MPYKSVKQFIKVQKKFWHDFGGMEGVETRAFEGCLISDMRREMHHKRLHLIDQKHFQDRLRKKYG